MNTNDLNSICRNDPKIAQLYLGTFACDQLPPFNSLPSKFSLCVNTDKSTSKLGGVHWQSIFVQNGRCYFFDSFGRRPKGLILKFCENFPEIYYNRITHQMPSAITCGAFSIYHIHMQSRGRTFLNIVEHFIKINKDDEYVTKWIGHAHNFRLFDAQAS